LPLISEKKKYPKKKQGKKKEIAEKKGEVKKILRLVSTTELLNLDLPKKSFPSLKQ